MIASERRSRRSSVSSVALQWLLDAQMSRASLDAITIATDDGLVVASAGRDASDCEMLAVVAADVARGGNGLASHNRDTVSVFGFEVAGEQLYVAMRGGDRSKHSTVATLGVEGAKRILS